MLEGIGISALNCIWRYLKDVLAIYGGVSDGGKVQPSRLSEGTQLTFLMSSLGQAGSRDREELERT